MKNKREKLRAARSHKPAMASDVARLAGVSVSAVSRTFTAGASVSEGTRKKVLDAARTLRYRPANAVQTAYLKGSYIIALAIAELDDLYYARVVQQFSDALAPLGYRLLIFVTHGNTTLDPMHRELLHFRVDALILATANYSLSLAEECRQFGIPVVMFNNADPGSATASVAGANFQGGRQIAAFLVAGGHRKLAFIAGVDDTSMEIEREAGFNSYLSSVGMPKAMRALGGFTYEGAVRATRKFLSAKERPDAIFCNTDHMAIACLQAARGEFGLEPGRNISIVGFDDVEIASWPAFNLTTYSQPSEQMVQRTVTLLRGLLKGDLPRGVHEIVPGELIVRGSARLPAKGIEATADGKKIWRLE